MHTANITVKYVNEAKSERAISGSIKDEQGTYYSVPKQYLAWFQPGQQCEIEFAPRQGSDGRQYNDVKSMNGQQLAVHRNPQPAAQAVAPQYQPQAVAAAPVYHAVLAGTPLYRPPQTAAPAPGPAPPYTGAAPAPGPAESHRERYMYITGVVGRAMGSSKFEKSDIMVLTMMAADAWHALSQWQPPQTAATPQNVPQAGPQGPEPPPHGWAPQPAAGGVDPDDPVPY